ncbi:MAG: bifunctional folylpolyglutamate synthase/dihydrofolate synthase [Oscillospiraceae bacterium]|nr:bifunctional folylpolyglutamate synthase/dihydrofolate synthase [Oscillospiraceae bacterium]
MTYKEALDYISSTERFGSRPGLSRISELLEKLDNPHKGMKFVHIAGTNGKGSCAAMCASVLKAAGYKTGLYTSPYIFRFNERMQINGMQIEDDVLADIVAKVKPAAESMEDHPTEFELMTAAALLWYRQENCDIVVLEVGLGGRFDATNIIESPEAAVIMNIGLDHVTVLGDSIEQIAFEKAGIIKPGCEAVLYEQSDIVTDVIRRRCEEENAKLNIADFSAIKPEFDSLMGQSFSYKGEIYALPLLGSHQLKNAAVVLETVEVLRKRGWRLEQSDVEHGLYAVSWPGRFELINDEPEFIVDGGHNPQCAQSVQENLLRYFPGVHRVLLIGVLRDKDFETLAEILDKAADEYVCISPNNPRALPAEELAASLEKFGKKLTVCESIEDGVETAMDRAAGKNGMVCAVGSLYSVGDIRAYFGMY